MHVTFDRFELDSARRLLLIDGEKVPLSPKALRLLETLITDSPRAMSKQELQDAIWPQTFVEESSLAGLVRELRVALGDDPRQPRFIRTVHGFGYAFGAEVREAAARTRVAKVLFRGEELALYAGSNVLGRDATADVPVDDVTVSRRHACITITGSTATIRDMESKNGTFLDGERLFGEAPLIEGQTITLGDARMIFRQSPFDGSTLSAIYLKDER